MAPFVGLRRHAPLAAQKGRRKSWGDSCCGDGKAEPSAPRCLQQGRSAPAPPAGPALPSFPPHSVWCEWFRSAPGTWIVIHAPGVCHRVSACAALVHSVRYSCLLQGVIERSSIADFALFAVEIRRHDRLHQAECVVSSRRAYSRCKKEHTHVVRRAS